MSFSLFTTRTREPSSRLRFLARGFQFSGIASAAVMAGLLLALPFFNNHAHTPRYLFTPAIRLIAFVFLSAASSFLIGRGLLKRQRWGAYLAGVTLGVPFVKQLLSPDSNILSVQALAIYTVALCVTVTVWDELGSARDGDLERDDDDETLPTPIRNRGYGEGRVLPRAFAPHTFGTPRDSQQERIPARGPAPKIE